METTERSRNRMTVNPNLEKKAPNVNLLQL